MWSPIHSCESCSVVKYLDLWPSRLTSGFSTQITWIGIKQVNHVALLDFQKLWQWDESFRRGCGEKNQNKWSTVLQMLFMVDLLLFLFCYNYFGLCGETWHQWRTMKHLRWNPRRVVFPALSGNGVGAVPWLILLFSWRYRYLEGGVLADHILGCTLALCSVYKTCLPLSLLPAHCRSVFSHPTSSHDMTRGIHAHTHPHRWFDWWPHLIALYFSFSSTLLFHLNKLLIFCLQSVSSSLLSWL